MPQRVKRAQRAQREGIRHGLTLINTVFIIKEKDNHRGHREHKGIWPYLKLSENPNAETNYCLKQTLSQPFAIVQKINS